uniref:RNA helicase n=1 Tax=Hydra vulgaris TaxID=6087 RepID=Q9GV12_HYDVU|nr:vasa-related protein CnVAS2 [Hydra vulgaris]
MFAALKAGAAISKLPQSVEKPVYEKNEINNNTGNRRGPQVKVFNIPEGSDSSDLKAFFSSAGDVRNVKILPVRDGKTTTLGFVEFASESECQNAIQQKNEQDFNGSTLRVVSNNETIPKSDFSQSSGGFKGGNRFQVKVYNIPNGTDSNDIQNLFGGAGTVKEVKILPCQEGKNVTLGFVHFESAEDVSNAVAMFNNIEFNGSKLRVLDADNNSSSSTPFSNGFKSNQNESPSKPMGRGAQLISQIKSQRAQAKVFGIPSGTSEDDVMEYFSSARLVKNVKLLPIREGKDTHLCFIEYESNSEVEQAVQTLNGTEFNGSQLKVMNGENQINTGNNLQNGKESSWGSKGSAPINRIPKEDRAFSDQFGEMVIGEFKSDACRRCGEVGHYAKECLNAAGPNGSAQAVTYIPPPPPETENEIFEIGSNQGINFEKYKHIPIELSGTNRPKPIQSFSEANLHPVCLKNLDLAKYKEPTPIQKYAIPAILAKRDVMACAQTGSGKTASFLLPIITNLMNEGLDNIDSNIDGVALPLAAILAPTRELVVQLFTEARKFSYNSSLKPVVLYGGVAVAHQADRLRMGCHLLVATPGRLEDFIKRGKVNFQNLKYLILDEADKMIDMGFGPQIEHIIEFSGMPPKGIRNTLMFSATFPDQIQHLAAQFLNDYLFLTVGRVGGTCTDVTQSVIQVSGTKKRETLENLLQTSGTDQTLVFVEKKRDADFLANFLSQKNFPPTILFADRTREKRESALRDFRNGIAPILVATAVAARGLDINDVKHVINYDLPKDANEYVHRIGRTGRIGNKGKATSFFDLDRDGSLARSLVKLLSDAEQDVPDWLENCALGAVGTGYGPDNSQFRDQRIKTGQNGNSNKKFPNATAATKPTSVLNDDEEEW